MIFDATPCDLGEGPLWHPEREQLFWFDILNARLHTPGRHWQFAETVSAAGWIDRDRLLIASETRLFRFALETGAEETLCPLEADNAHTRSNDGRADPQGGFWIGTMGKAAQDGAGAIYRWYRGELRRLYPNLSIPNAICFTPDGRTAQFTDTPTRRVMRVALDAEGWPAGEPELFLDLSADGLNPDGATIDAAGTTWIAQWGASRVAAYAPDGTFVRAVDFPAPHASCPAFGGPDLTTLYCTSARQGMNAEALDRHPDSGCTFAAPGIATGKAEHRVTA
jgi:sugar lactone lactonase YvrE